MFGTRRMNQPGRRAYPEGQGKEKQNRLPAQEVHHPGPRMLNVLYRHFMSDLVVKAKSA